MPTEKEVIERLSIRLAVEHALVKNGVRLAKPIRAALSEVIRTTWPDGSNEPVISAVDEKGKTHSVDDYVAGMKRDSEWAPCFDAPKAASSTSSGERKPVEFTSVSDHIRQDYSGQALKDVAAGRTQVIDSRRGQPELGEREVSADALMGGTAKLEDIASGRVTVKFSS